MQSGSTETLPSTRGWRALLRLPHAVLVAAAVAAANFVAWQAWNAPIEAPEVPARVTGLAYNAFQRWDDPFTDRYPSDEQIDADLRKLAAITGRLRTYSSSEFPSLPAIAQRQGLRLTAGVWLDRRQENNAKELAAVVRAARNHGSIERVIAGNETILHGMLTPKELASHLDRLRRQLRVPVSTAEPWHVWLRHPQLARHVDFITVHLLPYWEGVPTDAAVDYAFQRLEELRARFPRKPIVIGEIGWPSGGDRFDGAQASPADQALFVRTFLARAQGRGLDYFLMEGVDQPWKRANEGRVGGYWGIFDAAREPKFSFDGPIYEDPYWRDKALVASSIGFVAVLAFLLAFPAMRMQGRIAFGVAAQAVLSFVVALVTLPLAHYLRPVDAAALVLLVPALALMAAILLAHAFEFAELFWEGSLKRRFAPRPLRDDAHEPFVTIHLACCNEPPEMVIATIESLRALDYRKFEVLVIDNNTRDEALWRPVEAFVERLPANFRFFHLPKWPGFKAGALNFALEHCDPRAEVVAVVDADYVVQRDWLRALVGHFDDPKVAVVQSPQAHRGWSRQPFRRMMNWEYDGFFRIGMHHRNERDAIIQHGTMTMIRAEALREHGRWSEWCICEDSELGLRLMRQGLRTVYVDRVMGEGLTPSDFASFRKQRRRWAQGAMQILKAHWRALLLPGRSPGRLTTGQRYHFVAGWLPWIGDALHLGFAFAAMLWTIGIVAAPHLFSLPITLFMAPLAVFFLAKLVIGPLLYWRRVPCSLAENAGAALAGMGLSHAIATGVVEGLVRRTGVFEVTRKGRPGAAAGVLGAVREESAMLLALASCIGAVALTRKPDHPESAIWMLMLALQAVPYAAALACEAISRIGPTASATEAALPDAAQFGRAASTAPGRAIGVPAARGAITSRSSLP
jgi:exo-beta-1,3-glucanase (GH17 family)/cellulose synthase/poly-beta-1,6-N-acetylglucosamine synthase-like glycosyltransferase